MWEYPFFQKTWSESFRFSIRKFATAWWNAASAFLLFQNARFASSISGCICSSWLSSNGKRTPPKPSFTILRSRSWYSCAPIVCKAVMIQTVRGRHPEFHAEGEGPFALRHRLPQFKEPLPVERRQLLQRFAFLHVKLVVWFRAPPSGSFYYNVIFG